MVDSRNPEQFMTEVTYYEPHIIVLLRTETTNLIDFIMTGISKIYIYVYIALICFLIQWYIGLSIMKNT